MSSKEQRLARIAAIEGARQQAAANARARRDTLRAALPALEANANAAQVRAALAALVRLVLEQDGG